MKKAIDKARANGLDIKGLFDVGAFGDVEMNIYELIFGTPFIEKLVGEGDKCPCMLPGNMCSNDDGRCVCSCLHYPEHKSADYHLQQMANLKNIEKLKEYIKKLGE